MKDDLFYLCWLLADSEELIDCLLNKDISTYDVTKLSELKKRDILNKACRLVNKKEYEDVLYDLIYKRNCDYGLSSVWDQSIHLVTENKHYQTTKGNLNFVFATNDIWNDYWELYYEKLPYIMNIVIEVATQIFEEILKPVSYTHLDVYKRQHWYRVLAPPGPAGCVPSRNGSRRQCARPTCSGRLPALM